MKYIPGDLQEHLDGSGTTLCYLLKIVAKNGTTIAVTSLDQDIQYDDGGGLVTYKSIIGMDYTTIQHSATLEIDNTEARMLIVPADDFTEQQINAGVLDFARYDLYRVNWASLADGHYHALSGMTGAVKSVDGLAGIVELRGLSQALKQSFVELYSLTCRAEFGSTGRFGCFFSTAALWDAGSVDTASTESDRVFDALAEPAATGPNGALSFVPGLLEFLTGNNAGLTVEIENVTATQISLRFPTPYPIEAGDTYRARPDCAKRYIEDCIDTYDNGLNFRGEPLIVPGDEASVVTPGASIPRLPSGGVLFGGGF